MGVQIVQGPLPLDTENANAYNGQRSAAYVFNSAQRDLISDWQRLSEEGRKELIRSMIVASYDYICRSPDGGA